MDYKEAFEILEFDLLDKEFRTITYLNKQYKKMALREHPDKNGNTEISTEKFKKINEAYRKIKKDYESEQINEECEDMSNFHYYDILNSFMATVFEGKYNDVIFKSINNIILTGNKYDKLLDGFDKETTFKIYSFLSKNSSILHLNEETINIIRESIFNKYTNIEVYKLNPSISDLINNKLFKLCVNEQLFYVPLWHNESYFDSSGCEIIVICEPEIPSHIKIDDNNNILVDITIDFKNLYDKILNNENIHIVISENEKEIIIPLYKLNFKKEQYYRIKNEGLTKIKKDIYDTSEKMDIIIKIVLK